MNILFIKRKSLGREDIVQAFEHLGHKVKFFVGKDADFRRNEIFERQLKSAIEDSKCDFVFSSNFFPIVSNVCEKMNIKYISWVYDCPQINLYSYTMLNECNYVFIFDKILYNELIKIGLKTVYYAPLASNPKRYDEMIVTSDIRNKYKSDVSFVGSLYNEKHNLFERLEGISDFTKGYLEAIIEAQLKVSGYYFVDDVMTKGIVEDMQRASGPFQTEGGAETPEYVFSQYFLGRKITQIERNRLLKAVSEKFDFKIYTPNKTPHMPKAKNLGSVNYENEMPFVFKNSKINLNITLRSIRSGVPLRAFDIMANKGFLLTNYQADFSDCFVENEDYVYYIDEEDMLGKIDYYLTNEKIRKEIAENGYNKILKYHTYEERLSDIIKIVYGDRI